LISKKDARANFDERRDARLKNEQRGTLSTATSFSSDFPEDTYEPNIPHGVDTDEIAPRYERMPKQTLFITS
jgi:hypothetical protein